MAILINLLRALKRNPANPCDHNTENYGNRNKGKPQTEQLWNAPALFDFVWVAHAATVNNMLNSDDGKPTLTNPKISKKWANKAHDIIVGVVVKIFSDYILPNNRANNRHQKHHDGEFCCVLEHPNHKNANAA